MLASPSVSGSAVISSSFSSFSSIAPAYAVAAFSSSLVACNVYISAGGETAHKPLLLKLLQMAQTECQKRHDSSSSDDHPASSISSNSPCDDNSASSTSSSSHLPVAVVVHAYADPIYNRSSIHLAGTADQVARVASTVALQAIQQLQQQSEAQEKDEEEDNGSGHRTKNRQAHPFVGLVDHVSFMPLTTTLSLAKDCHDNSYQKTVEREKSVKSSPLQDSTSREESNTFHENIYNKHSDGDFVPTTASGWAARQIGQALQFSVDQVFYYGTAHPSGISLAQVRREHTQFFEAGGLEKPGSSTTRATPTTTTDNVATVGAPPEFVENYNLRLFSLDYNDRADPPSNNDDSNKSIAAATTATSTTTTKRLAQSLTRYLRERNGGLRGVEALSLPYANGQWEVACNLLRPRESSADDVHKRALEWEGQQQQQHGHFSKQKIIETGYRVGTTAEQCWRVLRLFNKEAKESEAASMVVQKEPTDSPHQRRQEHDESVKTKLEEYLSTGEKRQ
ncbi:hypothetical protein ACA910_016167 [Epithemia clementina (nom. ined.)]